MCTFRLQVTVCGCGDAKCKQRNPEIQDDQWEVLPQRGHIVKVHSCFRDGPYCPDFFMNEDPDRLMVRYGMRPDNANSKLDCKSKKFILANGYKEMEQVCRECAEQCDDT
ncbi:hypothetical protein B0I35DRAFT_476640 [Stachybotrys elegans]|uniref:Uncharacterized protein n=1 Tax=Stachybotrys elegans TaxID=80388 RepID=A0A8K0SRM4_9HYPO|nr:hypothetical protein B0I35DRAFT_476640 [Stachybotrys elegans]